MNLIVNRRKDDWLRLRRGKRVARMELENPFIECDTPGKMLMPIVGRIYASVETVRVTGLTFL